MDAVCRDGRGLNGEGNPRELRLDQPPEKRPRTKDDDEDERTIGGRPESVDYGWTALF